MPHDKPKTEAERAFEETVKRLLTMPPKVHEDMKLGEKRGKRATKKAGAPKGTGPDVAKSK